MPVIMPEIKQQKKPIKNYDLLFPKILEVSTNPNQFNSARRKIQAYYWKCTILIFFLSLMQQFYQRLQNKFITCVEMCI